LVESRSVNKHPLHISHFFCIPIPNILVERPSVKKHTIHRSHLRCIPTPNVLVERKCVFKHIIHKSHLRCIPTPNVLVERRSGMKHIFHSSHFLCVPLRNIAVECTFLGKAFPTYTITITSTISTHIRHQTRIPVRHRAVGVHPTPSRTLTIYWCFLQTLSNKIFPIRIRYR
jgi:hypothetical protein